MLDRLVSRFSLIGLAAVTLVAASSCSSAAGRPAQQRVVFKLAVEHTSGPLRTDEIFDIVTQFYNVTGMTIRLSGMSMARPIRDVHVLGANVYNMQVAGGIPAEALGDMAKECPGQYVPRPVGSLVVRPRQYSPWFGVIAVRISRPGTYVINRIRVSYVMNGHARGWQYQNTYLTLHVSNPPLPGARPVPAAYDGCT
jgi:hypothetical protein